MASSLIRSVLVYFILLAATLFSLVSQARVRTAEIRINLYSGINVKVSGDIAALDVVDSARGFSISSAQVKVDDLSTKPGLAKGYLKKEKILDSKHYPYVTAKNIVCSSDVGGGLVGDCTGTLNIKGIDKSIIGSRFSKASDGSLEISLSFYLTDFNISRSVALWDLENKADVKIKVAK